MPELIVPTVRLHNEWLAARDEWDGAYQEGSGLRPEDDVDSRHGFSAWVSRLVRAEDPAEEGVPCTYRWIVEKERVLGAIALRHSLGDAVLAVGGHIGFGVRPSERGHGVASWALAETLAEARALGLAKILITCPSTNEGSVRAIERNGGVLEEVRDGRSRYWISLQ